MDREELKGLIYTIATEHLTNAVMDARQKILSEFDRLQAENEAQKITLAYLRKCLKDENESTTKLLNEQCGLQFWLDKICEPAIRDRGTEWSRVGQEITAMESLGNIYLYLDSQKQEQVKIALVYHYGEQGKGNRHEGWASDCPICNPKLLHPCPDCTWGQRKVYYFRDCSTPSCLKAIKDIIAYEPCPTCGGKRVIEEKGG
jgi:hypothetical protein